MNDNDPWPKMNQATASRTAKVLARQATWQLAEMPAYYGLPLAGFLNDEARALLVAVCDGLLAPVVAATTATLIETRSDAAIIGVPQGGSNLPQVALGLWWSGHVRWHCPLLPWTGADGVMWLVPARNKTATWRNPAFKLIARRLRGDLLPWRSDKERLDGFVRAAAAFAEGESK